MGLSAGWGREEARRLLRNGKRYKNSFNLSIIVFVSLISMIYRIYRISLRTN